MKVSLQAPEGFDPTTAPHRLILEAETDAEIRVLQQIADQLQVSEKSPIAIPRGVIQQ